MGTLRQKPRLLGTVRSANSQAGQGQLAQNPLVAWEAKAKARDPTLAKNLRGWIAFGKTVPAALATLTSHDTQRIPRPLNSWLFQNSWFPLPALENPDWKT